RQQVVAFLAAVLEYPLERFLGARVIELEERGITLAVGRLKPVRHGFKPAHLFIERPIRILITLAQAQLVSHITAEELVSAGPRQNHLVAALDLSQEVVQGQDYRADGRFVKILDDALQPADEVK